jgi:hypothetical protein
MSTCSSNCPLKGSVEAAEEVLGGHLQDGVSEETEDDIKTTRKPAVLGYEECGGLSDLGPRDCAYDIEYSRIRDRACPIPYICTEVNYSISTRVGPLS